MCITLHKNSIQSRNTQVYQKHVGLFAFLYDFAVKAHDPLVGLARKVFLHKAWTHTVGNLDNLRARNVLEEHQFVQKAVHRDIIAFVVGDGDKCIESRNIGATNNVSHLI